MSRHIVGFDYLRIVAIFSVVCIHGSDTSVYLRELIGLHSYAVPCFILMSVFLSLGSIYKASESRFTPYVIRRVERLLVPLFVWSFVYYGLRLGKNLASGGGVDSGFSLGGILRGNASYQLWFLPALFLYQLILLPILSFAKSHVWIVRVLMFCGFLVALLVATSQWLDCIRGGLNFLFLYYMPFVFIGALGFATSARMNFSIQLILCLFGIVIWRVWGVEYGLLLLSSLLIFILAQFVRLPESRVVAKLASYSMGVYLLHGVFLEGGQFFASYVNVDLTSAVWASFVILFAYGASLIVAALMMESRFVRKYHLLG